MNKQKKRKELQQLGIFRFLLLRDFPLGREKITEKPDFIIDDGAQKTGIEVTSIFHDPPRTGKPMQAQESERSSLLREALRLYNSYGNPPVHVSFHFSGESRFHKTNRSQYAKVIAELVASNLPGIGENQYIENEYASAKTFPFEIHSVYIHRLKGTESTFFNMPVAGWIHEDCALTIQNKLDSKEQALSEYQPCTDYWLLVVAEWSAPSSFFDPSPQTVMHEYRSSFDRVFFLNMFNRKLSELKVVGGAA